MEQAVHTTMSNAAAVNFVSQVFGVLPGILATMPSFCGAL
jgi:hypothetical protein